MYKILLMASASAFLTVATTLASPPARSAIPSASNPFISQVRVELSNWAKKINSLRQRSTDSSDEQGEGLDNAAVFLELQKRQVEDDLKELSALGKENNGQIKSRILAELETMARRYEQVTPSE